MHEWVGRKRTHTHMYVGMDATSGEADPRLRQGSSRLVAAAEEVVAAAADGFIDWHCRHRLEESVSGPRGP